MSQLNLYYRAFKEYRKYTLPDKACIKQRQRIKQYSSEHDKLESIRTTCVIDEKWVEQIELGLPFVEKAIAEERQFIKNEGEVLDIEKVKRVSKDSVEHLARHSDLITHVPKDGGDLIPDKIYMVERLSDYAVYENRFLYMLLCYLRDFIDIRLKKIKELGNTYNANTYIKRDMLTSNGKIFFEGKLVEQSKRDPYSSFNKNSISLIGRIESCQHLVTSLLAKPLMVIVSKTPMIKPPITKTNVLKMNTKFKNSVALYEYLAAYEGPGYEIVEEKKTFSPFGDELCDELSEIINLTSFLTYEYGNGLNETLKKEYEAEERELKERERIRFLREIEELKARLEKKEISIEEYVYSVEKALEDLKSENQNLKVFEKDLAVLKIKHEDLKQEKIGLNKKLAESEKENMELNAHIDALNIQHEKDLQEAEERRISDLENQANDMTLEFNEKTAKREQEYAEQMNSLRESTSAEYATLKGEFDALSKKNVLMSAELHAVKGSQGLMEADELVSEAEFTELEKELVAFYDMFVEKWKQAKRQIRQDVLWNKFKKLRDKVDE